MLKKFKVFFMALIAFTLMTTYIPVMGENVNDEPPGGEGSDNCRGMTNLFEDNLTHELKQGDIVIDKDDKIDLSKPITIDFDMKLPVKGDFQNGDEEKEEEDDDSLYFKHGDCAEIVISGNFSLASDSNFKLVANVRNEDNELVEVYIGNVEVNNENGNVVAKIFFNGDPAVYDGDKFHNLKADFYIGLFYSGDENFDENGEKVVGIMGKDFTLTRPDTMLNYNVDKKADLDYATGVITWTVDIKATVQYPGAEDSRNLNLDGLLFSDNLSKAGEYIEGSFKYGDKDEVDVILEDGKLSHTFPENTSSPLTITYQTKLTDEELLKDYVKKENIANLSDGKDMSEDAHTFVEYEPNWISKSGKNTTENSEGTYDPKNNEITWTITINSNEANLKNVTVYDELPEGLTWKSASIRYMNPANISLLDKEPEDYIYKIGDITDKVVITIVSTVDLPDGEFDGKVRYFTNNAVIRWDGQDKGYGSESGNVGIGYNPIFKSGSIDEENHQLVEWNVKIDTKGQENFPTNFVTYDLIIHGKDKSALVLNKIDYDSLGVTNEIFKDLYDKTSSLNQTYHSFETPTQSNISIENKMIKIEDKHVADLLIVKINNTDKAKEINYKFKTKVVNPDITLGNVTNYAKNTVTLYTEEGRKINESTGDVKYVNNLLKKEVIDRDEHKNIPSEDSNKEIEAANKINNAKGYNYLDNSVVYRLTINADGLNVSDIEDLEGKMGKVTVTDTLPDGWVFTKFSDGREFLLYESDANGNAIKRINDFSDVLDYSFTSNAKSQSTFTFNELNKGYIILIKAKPTEEKMHEYFGKNIKVTETNNVVLTTKSGHKKEDSENVTIKNEVLGKDAERIENGVAKWTITYNPINSNGLLQDSVRLTDTLPLGIELQRDYEGNIRQGVITLKSYELGIDGSLINEKDASFNVEPTYNPETRELIFEIPDKNKAYKITYKTDLVGDLGKYTNTVKMEGITNFTDTVGKEFEIKREDSNATIKRLGYFSIKKVDENGEVLDGVEFTLEREDGTFYRKAVTGADGILNFRGLVAGKYILKETGAKDGYDLTDLVYSVKVTTDRGVNTIVNGKEIEDSLIIINHKSNTVGSLEIKKTVSGNAGDKDKGFKFNVMFEGLELGTIVKYIDNLSGNVYDFANGGTIILKHNQTAKFVDIPNGTKYTVTEDDYRSEGYEQIDSITGEIVQNEEGIIVDSNIEFKNVKINKFTIEKKDSKGDLILESGIKFNIYDVTDGETPILIKESIESVDGYINFGGIPEGKYELREISTHIDYVLNTEVLVFFIENDDKGLPTIISFEEGSSNEFINYQGSVELNKVDESGKPLLGVVFELYRESSEIIDEYTTNSEGKIFIEGLVPGVYYFKEVSSVDGNLVNTEKHFFTIVDSALNKPDTVVITVSNAKGLVEFNKVNENGDTLAGAKFELYLNTEEGLVLYSTVESDEDGYVFTDGLVAGDYVFKEVTAADGYILNTKDIEFNVPKEAEVEKVVITLDDYVNYQGSVIINKVDKDGNLLKGAKFELLNEDLEVLQEFKVKSGTIQLDDLSPGKYFIRETKAPRGYKLSEKLHEFTIDEESFDKPEAVEIDFVNTKLSNVNTGLKNNSPFFLLLLVLSALFIAVNTRYYVRKRRV